ncbi:hypothetical protein LLEC1_03309 [Akanthomyces lecanii]|uniref:Phytocyanin domain-containing protein n=1 Tax=Cordyceps confragosa TaxID=2714763 RepID=A0A179IBA7_CORDF|nr:hypothetical protein LLEC1_03309 [Akanthomyces lecanii]
MKFAFAAAATALVGAAQGERLQSLLDKTSPLLTTDVRSAVKVQVVSVGRNPVNNATGLKFWPDKIEAEPGSMVQFQFPTGNHSVVRSDFDNPCKRIDAVNPSALGMFSGFQPAAASVSKGVLPVFTVMVNDTKPMWFYCSQGNHCEEGMALVINENTSANSSRSLENYKKLAAGVSPSTGGSTEGASNNGSSTSPESESGSSTTPVGAASSTPATAGASIAGVSSSMLLALGAVFMLL